jgi:hypothetical protein
MLPVEKYDEAELIVWVSVADFFRYRTIFGDIFRLTEN